jgi:putative endonuclease
MSASEFSLYILRCADGTLYTGIAVDIERRLAEHRSGRRGARYLRGRGPLELVFSAVVGDRATASKLEYRVKQLSRAEKAELVAGRLVLAALDEDQVLEEGSA